MTERWQSRVNLLTQKAERIMVPLAEVSGERRPTRSWVRLQVIKNPDVKAIADEMALVQAEALPKLRALSPDAVRGVVVHQLTCAVNVELTRRRGEARLMSRAPVKVAKARVSAPADPVKKRLNRLRLRKTELTCERERLWQQIETLKQERSCQSYASVKHQRDIKRSIQRKERRVAKIALMLSSIEKEL